MRVVPLKRLRVKSILLDVAVLEVEPNVPKLDAVTIIARRDLVFLQRFFNDLSRGRRVPDYKTIKNAIERALNELANPPTPTVRPSKVRTRKRVKSSTVSLSRFR